MNILFITLDSLRYDVADALFRENKTPNFQRHLGAGWQRCHTPGSYTYAAHQSFFAGFLPTPAAPGKTPRYFAAHFTGSETTTDHTLVFDTPDIVTGFSQRGFRTICIGGVGFFNHQTALGRVLPSLFEERYWETSFGVTDPASTQHQFEKAAELVNPPVETEESERPLFLFINISAIHQPNYFYLSPDRERRGMQGREGVQDTMASHGAALEYVDSKLPILFDALQQKARDTFCIVCSDHGTAYGEDGYYGHRIGHPSVWEVPMASFILRKRK